jgi:hypothetical protein
LIGRVWSRAEGWRGGLVLFALALFVYWLEALAWPLQRGRDSWDYWLYYLQLLDHHPPFSYVMVFRTPLAPIVTGLPMSIGGARLLEIVASVIYALAVLGWAWAVRPFGRHVALLVAAAVLALQLPYAALFHLVSSDFVFGALVPLWAGLVIRSVLNPSRARLIALGLATVALALARPAGQILILVTAATAVAAAGSARVRLGRLAIALAAVIVPLALWASVNAVRYDDFTVARGGKAWIPFFKVYGHGKVAPQNGSASRRLADALRRDVLTLPDFRRYHVDAETYFRAPSNFETIRLIALSDSAFGRSTNYDVLYNAAVEGIRKNPGWYAHDVASTMWGFVTSRFSLEPVERHRVIPNQPVVEVIDGRKFPTPLALSPLVQAVRYGFVWCPSDEIDRCILRNPARAYASHRDQRRYLELARHVRAWNEQLPVRNSNRWLAAKLGAVSVRLPRSIIWILGGLLVLALRRPRGSSALLLLLVGAGLVLLVHALSQDPQSEFELPLAPLFVLVTAAALVAPRETSATVQP